MGVKSAVEAKSIDIRKEENDRFLMGKGVGVMGRRQENGVERDRSALVE